MNVWKRWDPRVVAAPPIREVKRARQWLIEVVPDIFQPGHEVLARRVCEAIADQRYQDHDSVGRFLVRTAHPSAALKELRRIADMGSYAPRCWGGITSRIVLALYAETQAQFEEGVAALYRPRVKCEEVALTDPKAGLALALAEGWIYDFDKEEHARVLAKGPAAVAEYLRSRVRSGSRTRHDGMCVDRGGLALYLSPREPIDVGTYLAGAKAANAKYNGVTTSYGDDRVIGPSREFDWILCAGRIGPIAHVVRPVADGPHPMHPAWVAEIVAGAHAVGIPVCVPTLGEWMPYSYHAWEGDRLVSHGMDSSNAVRVRAPTESVDYDSTWAWGARGWDQTQPGAKPCNAYMQAVGSHLVGRTLCGRVFDEWPRSWCPR